MSSEKIDVSPAVIDFVNEIILNHGLSKDSEITYKTGSQSGDGFLSRNIAVSIASKGRDTLELFFKCSLDIKPSAILPIDKYYANEIHFYDTVIPIYSEFLREKGLEQHLQSIAKCYGTSTKNIIALENLRQKGYDLCDKSKPLDDHHIIPVFKSFARIHAISFALKDQKRDVWEKTIGLTRGALEALSTSDVADQMFKDNINEFLASLDPVEDGRLVKATKNLAEELVEWGKVAFYNPPENEYDILVQGDCWCNNMMFLYESKTSRIPKRIIHIDWQLIKPGLPVYDLAYFFYTSAPKEAMDNLEKYLKIYHDELSDQIAKLGSKPEILYPYPVFRQQWKQHCKFGYYMAFMLIRIMLSEDGEHLNLEKVDFENLEESGAEFFGKIKNNDEYLRRLKIITQHMVDNEFI